MFPVYSELSRSSGGRGRGGGAGRMALALVVLAVCGARGAAGARDEDYGGLGMPHYEYEGAHEEGPRGGGGSAGDAAEYPERDAHSLDYQYEDDPPRGRGVNGRTYYAKQTKASEMWTTRRSHKKSKKTNINRDQDLETIDKYNNDETTENIKPDRRNSKSVNKDHKKRRRSEGHEPSLRTPAKFSRQKAEDPIEHPDPYDLDDPKKPHYSNLADDESYIAGRMTTRRKKRRKQRDRPQTSTEDADEVEDNSEHGRGPKRRDLRRRGAERWWMREPAQDDEERKPIFSAVTRSEPSKNEDPDDFENDDIKSDDAWLRRGPVPEAGAETEGGAPGLSPAATAAAAAGPPAPQESSPGDYDDYPKDVDTLARRRAMLERVLGGYSTAQTAGDTDTPPPSPPPPTNTAAISSVIAENATTAPTTLIITELPSTSTATEPATTVTDTTLTLVSQVPEEPRELSIAEKSRLSILKKSQKKDSLKGSMITKPPVLRHFTSSGGGGRRAGAEGMPESTTTPFALLNPSLTWDTPERLARIKRIMRERLVSRARSLRDLTDGWNDVVCEYVDDELLWADEVPYLSAAPPAHTPAPSAFVGCAVLLVSAVC